MAISTEGKFGIGLTFLFGVGAGATMLWPDAKVIGMITMAGSFGGLTFLLADYFADKRSARPKSISGAVAALAFLGLYALLTSYVDPKKPVAATAPPAPKVDKQGVCFIDFLVWHHDRKIAVSTRSQNRNKGAVNIVLMSRKFWLEGYPPPPLTDAEEYPLYPEQDTVTVDSNIIELGKDLPSGTVLRGRVDFKVRYGPSIHDTALLVTKGTVTIVVDDIAKGQDSLRWKPDPDSTPDCPGATDLINRAP